LNRRIAASAWAGLVRRTRQKAEASGRCECRLVDPRNTSRQCSSCGPTARENRPSQSVFRCVVCGHSENADFNAAKNICARGLRATARGRRPEVGAPDETRTGLEAA
jgi:putative transposase